MKSTLSILVAASALAALTACGGDSGDGPATESKVAITSSNQSAVVRASLNGGVAASIAQGTLGGDTSSGTLAARSALQRALGAAMTGRKGILSAGVHPTAVQTSTDQCGVSGTITTTFDDKDGNNQVTNGDVLTVTFAQCKDSPTSTLNGALTVAVTGTPSASGFDGNAQFQSLSVVTNGVTSNINGALTVHEVDGTTLSTTSLTVGTGGLTIGVTSSAYNDNVTFASGFVITSSQMGANQQISTTYAGTLTASSIGGAVTVATQVPLITNMSDTYPNNGVIKITGSSGSTVLATVLSNTQVQLQIDANGDGTYEGSSTVAWSTLLP